MLTVERLKELLHYDPEIGAFTWLVTRSGFVKAGSAAGSPDVRGYICIKIDGGLYKAHRLAWLYIHGEWPSNGVDHRNGVHDDNAIINLRDCRQTVNMQNRRLARSDSKTGVIGVLQKGRKFVAYIYVNGERRTLGSFATSEAAGAAYISAKRNLHPGCTI